MKTIDLVREFMLAFGQPIASEPNVGDVKLNELRVKLLREELGELEAALIEGDVVETLDALGDLQYVLDGAYLALGMEQFWSPPQLKGGGQPRISSVEDNQLAVARLKVRLAHLEACLARQSETHVAASLHSLNLEIELAWWQLGMLAFREAAIVEIHRSNMTKLGDDGKPVVRADGKVIKGPRFEPPRLREVLEGGR